MVKDNQRVKKVGFAIYGDIHVAGPMFDVHDNGQVYIDGVLQNRHVEEEPEEEPPTREELCRACEQTQKEGLWWGDTSWSVVYRVYVILNYKGIVSTFIDDVQTWPWKKPFKYQCNRYSVGKPLRRGKILGQFEKWRADGAQNREIKLGERLLEILSPN